MSKKSNKAVFKSRGSQIAVSSEHLNNTIKQKAPYRAEKRSQTRAGIVDMIKKNNYLIYKKTP